MVRYNADLLGGPLSVELDNHLILPSMTRGGTMFGGGMDYA